MLIIKFIEKHNYNSLSKNEDFVNSYLIYISPTGKSSKYETFVTDLVKASSEVVHDKCAFGKNALKHAVNTNDKAGVLFFTRVVKMKVKSIEGNTKSIRDILESQHNKDKINKNIKAVKKTKDITDIKSLPKEIRNIITKFIV